MDDGLALGRRLVAEARRVVALTGAGISTDSGIPDFRGPQGVWTKDPAAERTATIQDYLGDPELRRRAWQTRLRAATWSAQPNAGHRALVTLEAQDRLLAVITQNVDELHQRAGTSPELVLEVHGTAWGWVCWTCAATGRMAEALDRVEAGDPDPACELCGGVLKSTTVSFGQNLDPVVLDAAVEAVQSCDLLLAVGSTLQVHPVAGLVPLAARHRAPVVIVNAQPTPYDRLAAAVVRTPISKALPALVAK